MVEGLLGIYVYQDYLPPSSPSTFHGIVTRIFPELPETIPSRFFRVPKRVVKPLRFSFTVRDLIGEGFMIEPTIYMVDHLKLTGDIVKVFVLDSDTVKFVMGYHKNQAAQ